MPITRRQHIHSSKGTGLIEFSMVLPLIIVLVLGVVEVSYALLDQHIVTKLTREGSNLISRDTDLPTAAAVLKNMSTPPVNFDNGSSKVIFSIIKNVSTTGAANYNKSILYARYRVRDLLGFESVDDSGEWRLWRWKHTGVSGEQPEHRLEPPGHEHAGRSAARRISLHHGNLHQARCDHAVQPIRGHASQPALFDCLFLMLDEG